MDRSSPETEQGVVESLSKSDFWSMILRPKESGDIGILM